MIAKDRLKLCLVNDRISNSNQVIDMLKSDIAKSISNYMEIDADDLDVQITQNPNGEKRGEFVPVLNANIPIKSLRRFKEKLKHGDE
jgi:cell division topological specificity factor